MMKDEPYPAYSPLFIHREMSGKIQCSQSKGFSRMGTRIEMMKGI